MADSKADPLSAPSQFLKVLGSSPTLKVLDLLLVGRELDYSRKELADGAGVSWNTMASIWPYLMEKDIVTRTRKIGKQEMYRLNTTNELVKLLMKFYDSLIKYTIDNEQPSKKTELAMVRN